MFGQIDIDSLVIVAYPDPVLRKKCDPVETFDEDFVRVVDRMRFLMHEQKGVGLAAPQVGLPFRFFVWNVTGNPGDDRVSINPVLENLKDQVEAEEGCLSLPDITVQVKRASSLVLTAQSVDGSEYKMAGQDLAARVWQHENDHLDGRLILDYQSTGEQIANRKLLKEMTAKYNKANRSVGRRRK